MWRRSADLATDAVLHSAGVCPRCGCYDMREGSRAYERFGVCEVCYRCALAMGRLEAMNAVAYDALIQNVGNREAARVFFETADRLEDMAQGPGEEG